MAVCDKDLLAEWQLEKQDEEEEDPDLWFQSIVNIFIILIIFILTLNLMRSMDQNQKDGQWL